MFRGVDFPKCEPVARAFGDGSDLNQQKGGLPPIRARRSQRCITQHELVQRHTALSRAQNIGGQRTLLARRYGRLSDGPALAQCGKLWVRDANPYWGKKTRSTNPVFQSRQRSSRGAPRISLLEHIKLWGLSSWLMIRLGELALPACDESRRTGQGRCYLELVLIDPALPLLDDCWGSFPGTRCPDWVIFRGWKLHCCNDVDSLE